MNPEPDLMDVLDHQPDLFADTKIKAIVSDIYDNIIKYVKNQDSAKIADLITTYGNQKFVELYISDIYLASIDDVKIMSYITDNVIEICEILSQALSNITPKQAIENMDEQRANNGENNEVKDELEQEVKQGQDGVQEVSQEQTSSDFPQEQEKPQEEQEKPSEEISDPLAVEHQKATDFIKQLMGA